MSNETSCAACGAEGEISPIGLHEVGGKPICGLCWKPVLRGQKPLADGPWWEQQLVEHADGTSKLYATGQWVTTNTWTTSAA